MPYTAINELPTEIQEQYGTAWRYPRDSPNLDFDVIQVHTGRLRAYNRMAGLGGLVVSRYQGEQTSYSTDSVVLTGLQADGSATGSVVGQSTRVARSETKLDDPIDDVSVPYPEFRWPIANLAINGTEFASRAANRRRRGHSSKPLESVWAREMDDALRSGLAKTAMTKMRHDFTCNGEKTLATVAAITDVVGVGVCVWMTDLYGVEGLIGAEAFTHLSTYTWIVIAVSATRQAVTLPKKRLSLSPMGCQPDRIATAAIMAGSLPLVRYKPQR
jgi:hypothetical protein